jgi:hypothetical protein
MRTCFKSRLYAKGFSAATSCCIAFFDRTAYGSSTSLLAPLAFATFFTSAEIATVEVAFTAIAGACLCEAVAASFPFKNLLDKLGFDSLDGAAWMLTS